VFITNILGFLADCLFEFEVNDNMKKIIWWLHSLAWVAVIAGYGCVFGSYIANVSQGQTPPWFVHIIVTFIGFLFCVFGFVQLFDFKFRLQGPEYVKNEEHLQKVCKEYDVLSLVAKTLLAWLTLSPLLAGQPMA
jgi:H+/Cl- antiporter ClcA